MHELLFIIALISFIIYADAIRRFFTDNNKEVNRSIQALKIIGGFSAAAHLYALWLSPEANSYISALALIGYALGLIVFYAAKTALSNYKLTLAFSSDSPEKIISTGIYGYIRHPFYLAYCLTWLSGIVATNSALTIITTGIMFIFYYVAARKEEEKFNRSILASEYESYKKRSGMFLPKFC